MDGCEIGADAIARWLRRKLAAREWSPADFARHLGVRSGTVSRWLNAMQPPSPAFCDRIADLLHEDPDLVLTLAGHRPEPRRLDPDDPRRRIVAKVKRVELNEERVAYLDRLLDEMAERPLPRPSGDR